jgi:RNA polymerase-interacting CarD/CdnL/TRCF family regulator
MSLSLVVGDRLVYPNQGLCTVTEIKTEEIAGSKLVFVSLVIVETGAKVKVPQDKLVKNGVRRVSGPAEVKKVFDFLKNESERASLDWKKRARDNTARLSEGGLLGLAEIVKGLQELSELRPLPPKEREQYNDARHLFVEELAASMSISPADAEDSLDISLFPVGKDRPKRLIEEFKGLGEDDELGLGGDDLLGLDGGEEVAAEKEDKPEDGDEEAEGGDDEAEEGEAKSKGKQKKAAKPAAAPKSPPKAAAKGLSALLAAVKAAPAETKKRGRPPTPKPEVAPSPSPPAPKTRGRPAKPKLPEPKAAPAPAKKRGGPTKAKP